MSNENEQVKNPSLTIPAQSVTDDFFVTPAEPVQASLNTEIPEQDNGQGEFFDEFATDEQGNPKLKKDGTPAKKRGRKAGQTNFSEPEQTPIEKETAHLATQLTGLFYASGQIAFDQKEWTPGDLEFIGNRDNLRDLLIKRNMESSPELRCLIGFGSAYIARLPLPETSAKHKKFFANLKDKFLKPFRRKMVTETLKEKTKSFFKGGKND